MWGLDYKECRAPKNWCFWTVVLEKTLESPLDCKEIHLVHPKGDQSQVLFGRIDVVAQTPILWPPYVKSWLIWKYPNTGKYWGQEVKGMTEDEMVGWYHRLNGFEFGQIPGVGDGKGGLACCSPWVQRVRHDWTTELMWIELNNRMALIRNTLERTNNRVTEAEELIVSWESNWWTWLKQYKWRQRIKSNECHVRNLWENIRHWNTIIIWVP